LKLGNLLSGIEPMFWCLNGRHDHVTCEIKINSTVSRMKYELQE